MTALAALVEQGRAILGEVTIEVGDHEFPLEIDVDKDVERRHPFVGQSARVTPYSNEVLHDLRGELVTITGVVLRRGVVAGYEFSLNGRVYWAPKKDLFVGRQYVEDVHLDSGLATHIRMGLQHFGVQHDYYGTAWDGVELLCYELAKLTDFAAVEAPAKGGWYKYESSSRSDQDGKDWRYVLPDRAGSVCINAHGLLHDGVWTLSTTVYSTRDSVEPAKLRIIRNADHWTRTLDWTIRTAEVLQTQGYKYDTALQDFRRRRRAIPKLRAVLAKVTPKVARAYRRIEGREWNPPYISIGASTIRQNPVSVGMHEAPTDERTYSVITVNPHSLDNEEYLEAIVLHETLHVALNTTCYKDVHGARFHRYADEVGLARKYRE